MSIISDHFAQLYTITLDNMGNNNTTCKTIEKIHNLHGLLWNSDEQQLPYVYFLFSHTLLILESPPSVV